MISWECVWESFFVRGGRAQQWVRKENCSIFSFFSILTSSDVVWSDHSVYEEREYTYRWSCKIDIKEQQQQHIFRCRCVARLYVYFEMMMSAMRMKRKSQWSLREKKKYKKSLFSYNRIKRANEQKQWFSS